MSTDAPPADWPKYSDVFRITTEFTCANYIVDQLSSANEEEEEEEKHTYTAVCTSSAESISFLGGWNFSAPMGDSANGMPGYYVQYVVPEGFHGDALPTIKSLSFARG